MVVGITKSNVREFWAFGVIVAVGVAGGAIWATKISGDVDALKAGVTEVRAEAKSASTEIRLLREAMIRAGTALDAPKGD